MASPITQEQAPDAVAPTVPEERQSTAAGDALAHGSLTQAALVGKPLGQLPGAQASCIDITSPTPTVGNGASYSQPMTVPAVPGHVGTYIGCVPGQTRHVASMHRALLNRGAALPAASR
jgi:hypothetical protein